MAHQSLQGKAQVKAELKAGGEYRGGGAYVTES